MVVPKDLRRIVAKWDEMGCFCIKTLSIFCDWMMLRVAKPSASRRGYQRVSVLCDFIFLWWLEGSDVTAKADFCFFFQVTLGGKPFYQKYYCNPKFDSKCPLWKIFLPSIMNFQGKKIVEVDLHCEFRPGPLHLPIWRVLLVGSGAIPTKTQLSNFLGTPGEDYFKGNPKSLNFYFLVIWWGTDSWAGTRRQSAGLPTFLVVGCNGWMSHSHESGRGSSCWGWRWGPVYQWHRAGWGGKGQPSQSHRIHVCMVYFP